MRGIIAQWSPELQNSLRKFKAGTRHLDSEGRQHWDCELATNEDDLLSLHACFRGLYGASCSKLYVACKHIQSALPRHDYLEYALFWRVMLEQTAVLVHIAVKLAPLFENGYKDDLSDFVSSVITSVAGGRFNWNEFVRVGFEGLLTNPEARKPQLNQVNILTCVQRWGKIEPRIFLLYEILCETVHPNFGSNMLFMHEVRKSRGFSLKSPSDLGDFMVWNTFEEVCHVQGRALGGLRAMRHVVEKGRAREKKQRSRD